MEHEEALVDHILKVSGNTSLPIHQDSGTTVVVFVVIVDGVFGFYHVFYHIDPVSIVASGEKNENVLLANEKYKKIQHL